MEQGVVDSLREAVRKNPDLAVKINELIASTKPETEIKTGNTDKPKNLNLPSIDTFDELLDEIDDSKSTNIPSKLEQDLKLLKIPNLVIKYEAHTGLPIVSSGGGNDISRRNSLRMSNIDILRCLVIGSSKLLLNIKKDDDQYSSERKFVHNYERLTETGSNKDCFTIVVDGIMYSLDDDIWNTLYPCLFNISDDNDTKAESNNKYWVLRLALLLYLSMNKGDGDDEDIYDDDNVADEGYFSQFSFVNEDVKLSRNDLDCCWGLPELTLKIGCFFDLFETLKANGDIVNQFVTYYYHFLPENLHQRQHQEKQTEKDEIITLDHFLLEYCNCFVSWKYNTLVKYAIHSKNEIMRRFLSNYSQSSAIIENIFNQHTNHFNSILNILQTELTKVESSCTLNCFFLLLCFFIYLFVSFFVFDVFCLFLVFLLVDCLLFVLFDKRNKKNN